jgi:hypothetical protein
MFPTTRNDPLDAWTPEDFDGVGDDETVEPIRPVDERTADVDLEPDVPHRAARASRRHQASRRNRAWRRRLGRH